MPPQRAEAKGGRRQEDEEEADGARVLAYVGDERGDKGDGQRVEIEDVDTEDEEVAARARARGGRTRVSRDAASQEPAVMVKAANAAVAG